MAETRPVPTVLVSGCSASERESRIANDIRDRPAGRVAILLEGIPDGRAILEDGPALMVVRTAPGCLCCTGNLVMKVTLNRLLQRQPARVYIGVAPSTHLTQLRQLLASEPYSMLLRMETEISG